jgi:hypothetical protein
MSPHIKTKSRTGVYTLPYSKTNNNLNHKTNIYRQQNPTSRCPYTGSGSATLRAFFGVSVCASRASSRVSSASLQRRGDLQGCAEVCAGCVAGVLQVCCRCVLGAAMCSGLETPFGRDHAEMHAVSLVAPPLLRGAGAGARGQGHGGDHA